MLLISLINVGTTKLIYNTTNANAESIAQAHFHHETKSLVTTYLLANLETIMKDKPIFRPLDVKNKLPEHWKDIDPADLTRIIKQLVRVNVLKVVEEDSLKQKKWGHPSKNIDYDGRRSFYSKSDYYNNIQKVLAKPEAINLIYKALLYSRSLEKYKKHSILEYYYVLKKKDKTAWNIFNAVSLVSTQGVDFKDDYRKIQYIDNDRELKSVAKKEAKAFIESHHGNQGRDYMKLYLRGGIYFPT